MSTRHVYATVNQLKSRLQNPTSAPAWTESDDELLALLETCSRRVDEFTDRSLHGSGFGPRVGINYYDGDGTNLLILDDDLVSITNVTVLGTTLGEGTTFTENTDFFTEPYNKTPKRRLRCHGQSGNTFFSRGRQTVAVSGTFGYADDHYPVTETLSGSVTASGSTITVPSVTTLSVGHAILIGSEQLLTTGITNNVLTVERGVNGTTAASHADGSAIEVYRYHTAASDATLRIAHRRWRATQAGVTGNFGGMSPGSTEHRDTEWSILYATVGHLTPALVG